MAGPAGHEGARFWHAPRNRGGRRLTVRALVCFRPPEFHDVRRVAPLLEEDPPRLRRSECVLGRDDVVPVVHDVGPAAGSPFFNGSGDACPTQIPDHRPARAMEDLPHQPGTLNRLPPPFVFVEPGNPGSVEDEGRDPSSSRSGPDSRAFQRRSISAPIASGGSAESGGEAGSADCPIADTDRQIPRSFRSAALRDVNPPLRRERPPASSSSHRPDSVTRCSTPTAAGRRASSPGGFPSNSTAPRRLAPRGVTIPAVRVRLFGFLVAAQLLAGASLPLYAFARGTGPMMCCLDHQGHCDCRTSAPAFSRCSSDRAVFLTSGPIALGAPAPRLATPAIGGESSASLVASPRYRVLQPPTPPPRSESFGRLT